MKNLSINAFIDLLEEMGRTFANLVRVGLRAVVTLSWPALLVAACALALALTIVPLAICLFILFMALKLIVAATVLGRRRRARLPAPPPHADGQ